MIDPTRVEPVKLTCLETYSVEPTRPEPNTHLILGSATKASTTAGACSALAWTTCRASRGSPLSYSRSAQSAWVSGVTSDVFNMTVLPAMSGVHMALMVRGCTWEQSQLGSVNVFTRLTAFHAAIAKQTPYGSLETM